MMACKLSGQAHFTDGCEALQHLTLPSSVTELDNSEFDQCANIIKVKLNEGLVDIGEGAFHDCLVLQK